MRTRAKLEKGKSQELIQILATRRSHGLLYAKITVTKKERD
jgi:hypothetical protein